ncbi:hypothetical protein SPRG_09467 [Saprolegnia parasitica CBS 223.65]|uniref:Uncharacterized protein n=1 Tax=Saprolegnia parasitica (strain CBS 223.65) TaxID=695850 RepID=A0A067C403_SAPPC|nr:hypothetical protein SPRG_09467 [Saprolegnia parasitica CBS 223.65]KDO25218.1 hypothetical protein SPRG_09467 [Saprolegnia parasitica CBS 223.65]|eukprot:XP_012204055.1 hypothetical protein SPRG_09467 [Saprolegnia parasitica CBS 223.65]
MKTKWGLLDDCNSLDVPEDKLWEAISGIIDKETNKTLLTYGKRVNSFVFKVSHMIEEHGLTEKLENGKPKAKVLETLVERIPLLCKSWSPKTKHLRDKKSSDDEEEQQRRKFKLKDTKPSVQKDSKDEGKERPCWHCSSKKHK